MILWMHPAAERELRDAVRRYNSQRPGLGAEFYLEFRKAQRSIADNFEQHSLLESSTPARPVRRALLSRFPFHLVFEVSEARIDILAVAHGSRRPNYWIRRKYRKT